MRAIDADKFKESLLARRHIGYGDYYNGAEAERDSIVEELDAQPTIATEKVGHWICGYHDTDGWYCSECKEDVMAADSEGTPISFGYFYCPNCGAKME